MTTYPPMATFVVDDGNDLIDVDAQLTLPALADRARAAGRCLPLASPLPPVALARAVASLPYLSDAFVHSARLRTIDGDDVETPRAPRGAVGPHVLAFASCAPPLAHVTRARLRCPSLARTEMRREQFASTLEVARRIRALVDEARAFSVDAQGTTLLLLCGPGISSGALAPAFAHDAAVAFTAAQAIVPTDVARMTRALDEGCRVAAAPHMGRATVWTTTTTTTTTATLSVAQATAQLAASLVAGVNA